MKGWEWMVLLILFWILLPLYSWKREQLFKENLEYGEDYYIRGSPVLPLGKKVIEVLAMFFIPFILAFVAGMMSLENPDQSNLSRQSRYLFFCLASNQYPLT
jgi:uncharacterized membrane protein YjgN (DUF898 family)